MGTIGKFKKIGCIAAYVSILSFMSNCSGGLSASSANKSLNSESGNTTAELSSDFCPSSTTEPCGENMNMATITNSFDCSYQLCEPEGSTGVPGYFGDQFNETQEVLNEILSQDLPNSPDSTQDTTNNPDPTFNGTSGTCEYDSSYLSGGRIEFEKRQAEDGSTRYILYQAIIKQYGGTQTVDSYNNNACNGRVPCSYSDLGIFADFYSRHVRCNNGTWEPTGQPDQVEGKGSNRFRYSLYWDDMDWRVRHNQAESMLRLAWYSFGPGSSIRYSARYYRPSAGSDWAERSVAGRGAGYFEVIDGTGRYGNNGVAVIPPNNNNNNSGSDTTTTPPPVCSASSFICNTYRNILGRFPDQAGALYYQGLIDAASGSTADVIRVMRDIEDAIADSPEANGNQPLDPSVTLCINQVPCS